MAAVRLTKKQRECAHPTAHVRATIDPRYERCHLCDLIRVAPIPAPWIIAYDEAQPEPAPPPVFEGYDPLTDPFSTAYADAAEEAAGEVEAWELEEPTGYDPDDEDDDFIHRAMIHALD